MAYISLATWRDLTDRHLYAEGDLFPHDGREVSPDRLKALETGQNQAGMALIRAVEEPKEQEAEAKEEAPRRAKAARKTAKPKAAEKAE